MKKSLKTIVLITIILVGFILASNAYAAGWSKWMKVTRVSSGVWGTYVYGNKVFPSGKWNARILNTAQGHSLMVAEILTSISLDKYMKFYIDDKGNIVQAQVFK